MDWMTGVEPALESAAKLALAKALRDLLLHSQKTTLTLADLLQHIDPQWHQLVRDYCQFHGLEHFDRHAASARLFALLDEGVALKMSDDEEAQLAVLRYSA